MTQEERNIKKDRMRYTKDKFSANLVTVAIVLDALYFVSIYKTDVGTYYYNWVIGASIIYNLLFMLTAFLASEGIKSRKGGYTPLLTVIGDPGNGICCYVRQPASVYGCLPGHQRHLLHCRWYQQPHQQQNPGQLHPFPGKRNRVRGRKLWQN